MRTRSIETYEIDATPESSAETMICSSGSALTSLSTRSSRSSRSTIRIDPSPGMKPAATMQKSKRFHRSILGGQPWKM